MRISYFEMRLSFLSLSLSRARARVVARGSPYPDFPIEETPTRSDEEKGKGRIISLRRTCISWQ